MHSVRMINCTDARSGINGRLGKADWERGELSNAVISSRLIGCFVQDFGFAFSLSLCSSSIPVVNRRACWRFLGVPRHTCSTTAAANATHIMLR